MNKELTIILFLNSEKNKQKLRPFGSAYKIEKTGLERTSSETISLWH